MVWRPSGDKSDYVHAPRRKYAGRMWPNMKTPCICCSTLVEKWNPYDRRERMKICQYGKGQTGILYEVTWKLGKKLFCWIGPVEADADGVLWLCSTGILIDTLAFWWSLVCRCVSVFGAWYRHLDMHTTGNSEKEDNWLMPQRRDACSSHSWADECFCGQDGIVAGPAALSSTVCSVIIILSISFE